MSRFVAFLRAINVGGHIVKMDHLRQVFGSLGFSKVETFIASGNVLFETNAKNPKTLEILIENKLGEVFGYRVATFIRTDAELLEIANYKPFRKADLNAVVALNIAFLAETLDAASIKKVMALRTEIDDLAIHGREVYWLCRKKQSESLFSNALLEKTLGKSSTLRGANTVQKIVAKYFSPDR